LLNGSNAKINHQRRVGLEPEQPVERVSVWTKPRRCRQLTRVSLRAEILHDHQPESLPLLPGEGRLPPLSVDLGLNVRDRDGRDSACVTALPQTVGAVDTAVHTHVRDFSRQKRSWNFDTRVSHQPRHRIGEERASERLADLPHGTFGQPTVLPEDGVHVQRGAAGGGVCVLGDRDDLLLQTLDLLVGAFTGLSRQVKLRELHAQTWADADQKVRRFRVARIPVWQANRTRPQSVEIKALASFVWH
jgi:hypothetical protein